MDDFSITSGDIAAAASSTPSASSSPSAAASPAAAPASTDTPASATASPATAAVPASTTPTTGEPPQERWPDILNNTRTKTRAEVEKEWEPYAWARQVSRQDWDDTVRFAQRVKSDPIGHLSDLVAELSAHPTHAQSLRSQAARILASARGTPPIDTRPDVVVDDGNGRQIATYSANRVQQIIQHAVQTALQKEVGPLKQESQQRKAAQAAAETRQHVEKTADALIGRAEKWHGYAEHKAAIAAALTANPEWSLHDAYLDVLHREILPSLSKTERAKVIADINQSPAASTVSPSTGTTSVPKPDAEKSWEELLREEFAAAGMTAR